MWHPGQCPLLRGPTDPEAPLSLSLLSLILVWSLSSLACPLLYMACWPAPRPLPCHHISEIQSHHTKSSACAPGDSWTKLSMFLQLAAVGVFQPSVQRSTVLQFVLLSSKWKQKWSVRWQWGQVACFCRANWLNITHIICLKNSQEQKKKMFRHAGSHNWF